MEIRKLIGKTSLLIDKTSFNELPRIPVRRSGALLLIATCEGYLTRHGNIRTIIGAWDWLWLPAPYRSKYKVGF